MLHLHVTVAAHTKKDAIDALELAIANVGVSCTYVLHAFTRIPGTDSFVGDVSIEPRNRQDPKAPKRIETGLAKTKGIMVSHNPDRA